MRYSAKYCNEINHFWLPPLVEWSHISVTGVWIYLFLSPCKILAFRMKIKMKGTAALIRKFEHVLYKLYPLSSLRFVKLTYICRVLIVLFCIILCNNAFGSSLSNSVLFCGIVPVFDSIDASWKILPGQ